MVDVAASEQDTSNIAAIRLTEDELKKGPSVAFCEICSRTFANGNAFRLHQVKTHSLVRGEADLALRHRKRAISEVERRYFCPIVGCHYNSGRSFVAYKLLHQHFSKVHCEKRFRCDKCKKAKFSLHRDLLYHQRKRCPAKDYNAEASTSDPDKTSSSLVEIKRSPKRSLTKKDDQNTDSSTSQNKQLVTNIIIVNVNVAPIGASSSTFRKIQPKPSPRATKCIQTDDVDWHEKTDMCHAGSQTAQWNAPELDPPVLHEYNDFHCQTHIASGVEFGTQIYPEDVISSGANVRHSKVHDDDFEFEDIWRHIETQTSTFAGNDALTQTAIDFMDTASMTDWDPFI